jgi:hypothetical protein
MKIRSILAAAALSCAGAAGAAPAHAAPVERTPYTGTETFAVCGGAYAGVSRYEGVSTISDANPSTGGQFFRFTNKVSFTDTITNPETGDYVTVSGDVLSKEIQPRALGDGVFAYVSHDVGRLVYRDASGQVLARESGVIVTEYTFDTLNDAEPGGEPLTEETVRVSGPRPFFEEEVFCAFLEENIG